MVSNNSASACILDGIWSSRKLNNLQVWVSNGRHVIQENPFMNYCSGTSCQALIHLRLLVLWLKALLIWNVIKFECDYAIWYRNDICYMIIFNRSYGGIRTSDMLDIQYILSATWYGPSDERSTQRTDPSLLSGQLFYRIPADCWKTCKTIVTMAHSMHFFLLYVVGVVSFRWGTRDFSKTFFGQLIGVISFGDMATSALYLDNFNPKSWYIWCCVHWMQYRQQCEIEDECLFTYKLSPVKSVSFKELITHKAVKHDVTATDKDW